jgi:hypothetical protein
VFATVHGSYYDNSDNALKEVNMAIKDDILESLQIVQESLRETLKETVEIRGVAIEEEVLLGMEKMSKNCATALKHARKLQDLVEETPSASSN